MNILITGGLGYIGSYLIENLQNCSLTVIDNLYTQRYCSLFNPKQKYNFIEQDFNNISIEDLKQFDYVIHLAAIVDAANSKNQKKIIEKVNFFDTIAFLYKCRQAKCKVIFPSSTSVYGVSNDVVYEDEPSFLNPQSPYADNKLYVEHKIINMSDLDYVILRLGTVCGVSKGMRFQTCINKFCYQASFNKPLTVWKQNIDMVRPYLCLSDILNTVQNIINNWNNFKNNTFNVVTKNLSLRNVIEKIEEFSSVIINYTDCPLLNQFSYHVCPKKIINRGVDLDGDINYEIEKTIEMLK